MSMHHLILECITLSGPRYSLIHHLTQKIKWNLSLDTFELFPYLIDQYEFDKLYEFFKIIIKNLLKECFSMYMLAETHCQYLPVLLSEWTILLIWTSSTVLCFTCVVCVFVTTSKDQYFIYPVT